jgi:diguanylate cyclase (GGDEF)-like protein
VSAAPLPRPLAGVVVVTSDITPQVRALDSERQAKVELERALGIQTKLAEIDPLTQVFNRRHFQIMAEQELGLAHRYRHEVSVIVLDLDHFKTVNDRYGHAAGDQVLKDVAQGLTRTLRSTDVLARHGGEEFVVLPPHTDSASALLVAENLRAQVADVQVAKDADAGAQTVSVGVATARHGESLESLVHRADEAMYAAKALGRDRVVLAADRPDSAP